MHDVDTLEHMMTLRTKIEDHFSLRATEPSRIEVVRVNETDWLRV